ncbi:hypothetical protein DAPPUDRAFT_257532 [Daphnia pulex]|uniref:Uncharacterized protein n=1 Tax=Daphnia pulex TaxID=6669 RepID=E9HDS4_DAPPU|nr:hypothetical protein DAPPUDRAFT_257532 [Daphnia pulex]|eukprot:EFX70075.1 hypothetical protein DAPPUDRAFT_257532 [Daphnia pulex]
MRELAHAAADHLHQMVLTMIAEAGVPWSDDAHAHAVDLAQSKGPVPAPSIPDRGPNQSISQVITHTEILADQFYVASTLCL